jgi:hypothetical protein
MPDRELTAVIRRLLEDDRIHGHISEAGAALHGAYRRGRRLPAGQAVHDKVVYDRLRGAASGAVEAWRRALDEPPPKPKRSRRVLAVGVLAATGAVVAWAAKQDGRGSSDAASPAADVPPVAPG